MKQNIGCCKDAEQAIIWDFGIIFNWYESVLTNGYDTHFIDSAYHTPHSFTSKDQNDAIQKVAERCNLKVKEANHLLQCIFAAIIVDDDDSDVIINIELDKSEIVEDKKNEVPPL